MDSHDNQHSTNKKRRTLLLLLLFFTIGGICTVTFIVVKKGTTFSGTGTVINSNKPNDTTGPGSNNIVTDPGIKHDMNILNDDSALAFDNKFEPGHSYLNKSFSDYLISNDTSFTIDLDAASFLTTPAICGNYLYVSGGFSSKAFYAFNVDNGKLFWAVHLSDDGPSSPIVTDSLVIFNTESCTIFALNRFSGKQLWSKWIGDPLQTHPVTDGKLIYTAYPSMTLFKSKDKTDKFEHLKPSHAFAAFDVNTGDVKWQCWLDGDVMTTPILCGDEVYLTTFAGTLYKFSKKDGKILNAAHLNGTSLPAVCKDRIYMAQRIMNGSEVNEAIVEINRSNLAVIRTLVSHKAPYLDYSVQKQTRLKKNSDELDRRNGFFIAPEQCGWASASKIIGQSNVSSLQNFTGSTIVTDNQKIYSCFGNEIICIDTKTGNTAWTYALPHEFLSEGGHGATVPMVTGNMVITATLNGDVLLLDKATGALQKKYEAGTEVRNQPLVNKGKIYVPAANGTLIVIDSKNKSLDGWTMFLKNNAHDCQAL